MSLKNRVRNEFLKTNKKFLNLSKKFHSLKFWQRSLILTGCYMLVALILSSSILLYINNSYLASVEVDKKTTDKYFGKKITFAVPKDAKCLSFSYDNEYYMYVSSGKIYIRSCSDNSIKKEITESYPITYSMFMVDRNKVIYFYSKNGKSYSGTTSSKKSSSSQKSSSKSTTSYAASSRISSSEVSSKETSSDTSSESVSSRRESSSEQTSSADTSSQIAASKLSFYQLATKTVVSDASSTTSTESNTGTSSDEPSSVGSSSKHSSSSKVSSDESSTSYDSSSTKSSSKSSATSHASSSKKTSSSTTKSDTATVTGGNVMVLRTYFMDNDTTSDEQVFSVNSGATIKDMQYSKLTNLIFLNTESGSKNNLINTVYKISIMSNIFLFSQSTVIDKMVVLNNTETIYYQDTYGKLYRNSRSISPVPGVKLKLIGRDAEDQIYFQSKTEPATIYVVKDKDLSVVKTITLPDTSYKSIYYIYSNIYFVYKNSLIDITKDINNKISYDEKSTFLDIIGDRIYLKDGAGDYVSLLY